MEYLHHNLKLVLEGSQGEIVMTHGTLFFTEGISHHAFVPINLYLNI